MGTSYILMVFPGDGNTIYYGVFESRLAAITYATKHNLKSYQATRLTRVERAVTSL